MARRSWTENVVGKVSCEISVDDHRWIQGHKYPGEPLYATVNRIIIGYKNSKYGVLAQENKGLKVAADAYLKRAKEAEAEVQRLKEKQLKILEFAGK